MSHGNAGARLSRGRSQGEFKFDAQDFARIAAMLHDNSGIYLPEGKSALVYSRLVKRLRALGLSSFHEYCELISQKEGEGEFAKMRDALTTNVTRFFREPHHFEHLRTRVLPDLLRKVRAGGKLRIWSAGCSSGQEPYSIALTILAAMPDARSYDIRILATDISENILKAARAGRYSAEEVKDVPRDMRLHWMEQEGDEFILDDAVKAMVAVKPLNLIGSWPMSGPFDAIFCRNVVIYFEEATQQGIWRRMLPLLAPHGALYIGHSERVSGLPAGALSIAGVTTYMRQVRSAA